ncbi:MAG TPA: hypothetical protein VFF77_01560 [Holophagaceae bacterium]|nr:hypothetical protein [Holophagaceae bacterium]
MRSLTLLALLSLPLAAQGSMERYMPGHEKDLYHREQEAKKNEATVAIVGTLSKEELQQIRFQEFMAWFLPDLHRFLGRYGDVAAPEPEAIRITEPPVQAKVHPIGPAADF